MISKDELSALRQNQTGKQFALQGNAASDRRHCMKSEMFP
jgi:hypothetical protein